MESYPGIDWARVTPQQAGMDASKLGTAKRWLDDHAGDGRYRVVVVRHGRVVAEWHYGCEQSEQLGLASATKSVFSCMLAIAIREGRIASADARVIDYYPEAMDVPEGEGPKEGRYVFPKDLAITFRQLISNTSGYMKPGEAPGKVFHYQTYGMNILTHAIAKTYGLWDARDPEGSLSLKELVGSRLRAPMQATWGYYAGNFDLHAKARINIFGYYDGIKATALDMARLGLLWLRWGRWRGQQLVPEAWLREATRVALNIVANCQEEEWAYGYAFWTNEYGKLWPHLPRDSYAASGAGRQLIWVCPSLDLVVVQSPGLYKNHEENDSGVLRLIAEACDS